MNEKKLFVLTGPTGVGKTQLSIRLAQRLGSPIISADSRQIYKELSIGTAMPSSAQLEAVEHFFIATKTVSDYYSASVFEEEAISLINKLFDNKEALLLCGGSMLYIDAVCKGIDEMPTVTQDVRKALWGQYEKEGLAGIAHELEQSDPVYYAEVDRRNYRRVLHAVEICRMTGKPYSSFRTNIVKRRPFKIVKLCLFRDRPDLYARIDARVDDMIANGLEEEARRLYPLRHLNALNTVGYKELFAYFDGKFELDEAIKRIKSNTHTYARKQITWFRRDPAIHFFHADDAQAVIDFIASCFT
jgi:tRNA dimethylallyltransferase